MNTLHLRSNSGTTLCGINYVVDIKPVYLTRYFEDCTCAVCLQLFVKLSSKQ